MRHGLIWVGLAGFVMAAIAWWPLVRAWSAAPEPAQLDAGELLREKRYLEVEALLSSGAGLDPLESAFVQGVMANRTNRVADSIRLLEPLVSVLSVAHKRWAVIALSTLADDYEKSFRYGDAADTYAALTNRFGNEMSAAARERARVEAERWNLLRRAPPQRAVVDAPFTLQGVRDALGLLEVQVRMGNHNQWMLLDTGANISAISRSTAQQLGLRLSSTTATSTGVSGKPMLVHTAVVPKLQLGRATFRHVAVMVVDDDDMRIPQRNYRIRGSIGFPVLSALRKITFLPDGQVRIAVPESAARPVQQNLFLEKLTPVVAVTVDNTQRLFTIDTGSTGSFLSVAFYREHRGEFDSQAMSTLELVGVGGSSSIPTYQASNVSLVVGGCSIVLEHILVLTASPNRSDDKFFGILGQSVLKRLRSYTFDFTNMAFVAESASENF